MITVIRKPYPKHKVGLATIPLYAAAFLPILLLSGGLSSLSQWILLLWVPCWFLIDAAVSRLLVWQVNSLRWPIWKSLLAIVAVGLIADLSVAGLIYALY